MCRVTHNMHVTPQCVKSRDPVPHNETDETLVNAFLERTSGLGLEEAGRHVGVSRETVRRWRAGDIAPLRGGTREALVSYMSHGTTEAGPVRQNGSAPADYPDGGIATADQIIETFGRPEALRRQAGHIPAKDAARAGYALAQRLQLPPAGMKRILEWHDEIMGAEGEGG